MIPPDVAATLILGTVIILGPILVGDFLGCTGW